MLLFLPFFSFFVSWLKQTTLLQTNDSAIYFARLIKTRSGVSWRPPWTLALRAAQPAPWKNNTFSTCLPSSARLSEGRSPLQKSSALEILRNNLRFSRHLLVSQKNCSLLHNHFLNAKDTRLQFIYLEACLANAGQTTRINMLLASCFQTWS